MPIGGLLQKAGETFGYRSHARRTDTNQPFSAGGASLRSGRLTSDPRINEYRDESIGELRGLRDEFSGNQGRFIQARVNPLLVRVAKGRGSLKRSLGRRNVFGTFGNQALTSYDIDTERAIADQRALATQESLAARTGIEDRISGMATAIQQGDLQGLSTAINSVLGIGQLNLGASELQDAAGARAGALLEKIIGGAMSCSHEFKENKEPLDYNDILNKFDSLDIERWNYKGETDKHVGPYAEDFNGAFDLDGGQFISQIDLFGVMMASIKALSAKVKELEAVK